MDKKTKKFVAARRAMSAKLQKCLTKLILDSLEDEMLGDSHIDSQNLGTNFAYEFPKAKLVDFMNLDVEEIASSPKMQRLLRKWITDVVQVATYTFDSQFAGEDE